MRSNITLSPAPAPGKGSGPEFQSRVPLYFRDFAAYLLHAVVVYRVTLEQIGVNVQELDRAHDLRQPRRSHCASTK